RVGKFTHPSGAPDNHLLTIYSPGPVNHQYTHLPQLDGGIYLIKEGKPIDEPGQMLLIKNDPKYNEQWPRALVPYKRIYGIDEPKRLTALANDGKLSPHLPAGTPFGLVGSSSLYKRESYPNGVVKPGTVTALFAGGDDRTGMVLNMAQTWHQVRPGEVRNDCGGCHAHSQKPTLFEKTAAAKNDYDVWDVSRRTPFLTTRKDDQSGKKWDKEGQTGLRFA